MAYVISTDADKIYLVTSQNTKKYNNIKYHPGVSLLIDTRGEQKRSHTKALTITGTCHILEDINEISKVRNVFKQNHPHLQNIIDKGDVAFLCVEFDSLLFLDGPENAHHEILR